MPAYATRVLIDDVPCRAWPGKFPLARRVANSYHCPRGMQPGLANVVLKRSQVDALNFETAHTLTFVAQETVTLRGLRVLQAQNLMPSATTQLDTPCLVTLADPRYVLLNLTSVNKNYNVPVDEQPHGSAGIEYFTDTTDAGTPWTWQGIVDDLWDQMPASLAGAAPTIPSPPATDPINYCFAGLSAWEAACIVFGDLGLAAYYNPLSLSFGLAAYGGIQSGLSNSLARVNRREFDTFASYGLSTHVPETIKVAFRKRQSMHSSPTWMEISGGPLSSAVVIKDVLTHVAGAIAGTVVTIHDSMPVELDVNGSVTNDADLQTRADAVALSWINRAKSSAGTIRGDRRVAGIINDVYPGEELAAVKWANYGPLNEPYDGCGTWLHFQPAGYEDLEASASRRLVAEWPLVNYRDPNGDRLGLTYWREPILCRLNSTLSAGGSAPAGRLFFDGMAWQEFSASSAEITVYDSLNSFNGITGDRCWVYWCRASGRYEILQKKC